MTFAAAKVASEQEANKRRHVAPSWKRVHRVKRANVSTATAFWSKMKPLVTKALDSKPTKTVSNALQSEAPLAHIGKDVGRTVGGKVHDVRFGVKPTAQTATNMGTHYAKQMPRYNKKYLEVPDSGKLHTPEQVREMVSSGQVSQLKGDGYNRLVARLQSKGQDAFSARRNAYQAGGSNVGFGVGGMGDVLAMSKAAGEQEANKRRHLASFARSLR